MNEPSSILFAYMAGLAKQKDIKNINNLSESDSQESLTLLFIGEKTSKERFEANKQLASLFGIVETQVKTFPVANGSWMIIDKHTKHMLAKDLKESEVETYCRQHNYRK